MYFFAFRLLTFYVIQLKIPFYFILALRGFSNSRCISLDTKYKVTSCGYFLSIKFKWESNLSWSGVLQQYVLENIDTFYWYTLFFPSAFCYISFLVILHSLGRMPKERWEPWSQYLFLCGSLSMKTFLTQILYLASKCYCSKCFCAICL